MLFFHIGYARKFIYENAFASVQKLNEMKQVGNMPDTNVKLACFTKLYLDHCTFKPDVEIVIFVISIIYNFE